MVLGTTVEAADHYGAAYAFVEQDAPKAIVQHLSSGAELGDEDFRYNLSVREWGQPEETAVPVCVRVLLRIEIKPPFVGAPLTMED